MTYDDLLNLLSESPRPPPVYMLSGKLGIALSVAEDGLLVDVFDENRLSGQQRVPCGAFIMLGRGALMQVSLDGTDVRRFLPTMRQLYDMSGRAKTFRYDIKAVLNSDPGTRSGLQAVAAGFTGLATQLTQAVEAIEAALNAQEANDGEPTG